MGSDCTVPIDDGLLNIRVGAIICRGNEFLMMENDKESFSIFRWRPRKIWRDSARGNCAGSA